MSAEVGGLSERLEAALDSHGTRQLLGLPDDEFDCCVQELAQVVAEWILGQRETVQVAIHVLEGEFADPSVAEYADAALAALTDRIEKDRPEGAK